MKFSSRLIADIPAGWHAKDSLTLTSADGSSNVIVSSEPIDSTVTSEVYAQVQGNLLRETFSGFVELSFEPTPLFGSKSGFVRRFHWAPPDGPPVFQVQVYYAEGDRGYTATGTCALENQSMLEADLLSVLGALRLRNGGLNEKAD